jgi:hypothetical protein
MKGGQALLLVFAEHVELEHAHRAQHPDQGQDQQPAQLHPADQQDPEQDGHEHHEGAEVGLEQDLGADQGHGGQPGGQAARAGRLPPGAEDSGQDHDRPDLGVLGRLDLVGTELEPGLGAVGGRPQRGQDQPKGDRHGPEDHPGPGLETAVVDRHGRHHHDQPEAQVEQLAAHGRRLGQPLGAEPGEGRGVDGQQPEGGQGQGGQDHRRVEVAPGGGGLPHQPLRSAPGATGVAGRPNSFW